MDEKNRTNILYGPQSWIDSYNANWTTDPSDGVISTGKSSPITSVEKTKSRGHGWPHKGGQATTDLGGDFSTVKLSNFDNHTPQTFKSVKYAGSRYIGPAWPVDPRLAIANILTRVTPATPTALASKGATAISRCLPTNPVADAGTFIGELKAGLPKAIGKELLKTKFKDYRKVGDEYLNIEFGWKPIVSDLQKFQKAAIESDKILRQLERDSGRNIRRKYSFPDEITTTSSQAGRQYCWVPSGASLSGGLYDSSGILTVNTQDTVKTWFSGCFTYHLNLGTRLPDKMARTAAEARKLYGVELTPATIWNLAPWSWIVDWEGNIGDVLHNVSRFSQDGLVMRYGYIMQEKTCKVTYTLNGGGIYTGLPRQSLQLSLTAKSKVRYRASPFGFGFDMTALTGRQSAILGALGISRGPRHL